MTVFDMLSCCFVKKNEFGQKTAGNIFTDKRIFTDKTLIKTENDFF